MVDENEALKKQIRLLEQELQKKNQELLIYRTQVREMNQQLEKVLAQINHEIQMAHDLQKILSPTEMPLIQGFDFSSKFIAGSKSGGDYFDIFEMKDKLKFGILLSSCSGYSISALFLTILIKMSAQVESRRGLEAHEMVKELADQLKPQILPKDKVNLFYGIVDKRSYELSYCAVGNIDVLLQHFGQEAIQTLEPCAGPLIKDFNTELRSLTVQLNPKDRCILCSEGIARSVNDQSEAFGAERIRESIRSAPKQGVHELRNEILYRLENFMGSPEPQRDCTVVALEVKDRVIKLAPQ